MSNGAEYRGPDRHSETSRPQTRIRSRPSALSIARYPAPPTQNTRAASNWSCCAFSMTGTVNSTSSGSPASAVDRSRTAIRSAITAVMPTPPAASSSRPGRFGAGGAYRLASCIPVPARSHSRTSEFGVGIRSSHECLASKIRFRYSTRPTTPAATQTAAGSVRSRVSAPAEATVITAPAAMKNHRAFW